jgi:phosphoribosyl 1,2-cyclic phosphodiesterase
MKFITLGSSSSGNGYLLKSSSGETLIIEAGVKLIEIKKALDFYLSMISGCIISHSHNDHSGKLEDYLNAGIRCYMSAKTAEEKQTDLTTDNIQFMFEKQSYQVGTFRVMPFDLKHDVRCFGFLIYHQECGFTSFISDTHYCPFIFKDLNNILIEANYSNDIVDKKLLAGNVNMFVRNRVLESHMEFETTKGFLKANDLSKVNNIVLIHLSDGNSNAPLFKREVQELTGKSVYIAEKGLNIEFNKTGI